ncbi:MAG: HDOD domain-containing protein [Candidatus Hydrogenedentes bacterium]|nr:HDOD domain-containing protein [Candidatus Hydrogenedentota bacterium]
MRVPDSGLGKMLTCAKCGAKRTLTPQNTLPLAEDAAKGMAPAPSAAARKRIGEMLLEAGSITRAQLDEALKLQASGSGKIVDTLISLGHLTHEAFVRFLSSQPGVASIDLSNYEIPSNLVALVPRDFALKHEVFPIDRLGKLLTLGMVCPLDSSAIKELEDLTGLRVKPLLCAPGAVRESIRRYYPAKSGEDTEEDIAAQKHLSRLAGTMKLKSVVGLIRQINTLPALPETVNRVREAMINPLSSVAEVGEIIKMDPPIAAKVLSVSNSAAYGFPSRVDDVVLGVTLLGLRETYAIVLAAAVVDFFESSRRFDYKAFWLSAMCCAAAARITAKTCRPEALGGAFSAGLLHDIGRVALAEVAGDRYAQVPSSLHGLDLIAAEEEVLGMAHPEAGYELAAHWSLPAGIAEAIRFHHNPERASKEYAETVAVTAVASAMAYAASDSEEDKARYFERIEGPMATLDLDRESAEAIFDEFLSRRDSTLRTS